MKRAPRPVAQLPLKVTYTVAALARAIGIGRVRMARLLRSQQVVTYLAGSTMIVPRSEIEEKLPALWESIRRE